MFDVEEYRVRFVLVIFENVFGFSFSISALSSSDRDILRSSLWGIVLAIPLCYSDGVHCDGANE